MNSTLASYHPFWLRLGVEVAVGRTVEGDLPTFIKAHFLRDPELLQRHHGARSPAFWAALGRLVLKRVLLLVALLDRAGSGALGVEGAPLLFRRGGRVRASGAALQQAAGALLGEGEMGRHLARLGYKVSHAQDPRCEFDFSVANLAVDLRDGLRLCRLAETLAPAPGLFAAARFPADRRPDRLHNVDAALRVLSSAGLSLAGVRSGAGEAAALTSAEVADGGREATLCLLWRLVLRFQLPLLVRAAELRIEMDRLRQTASPEGAAASGQGMGELAEGSGAMPTLQLNPALAADAGAGDCEVLTLLEWVQLVAGHYGAQVDNFGDAFADGSVLCLLVSEAMPVLVAAAAPYFASLKMLPLHFGADPPLPRRGAPAAALHLPPLSRHPAGHLLRRRRAQLRRRPGSGRCPGRRAPHPLGG